MLLDGRVRLPFLHWCEPAIAEVQSPVWAKSLTPGFALVDHFQ